MSGKENHSSTITKKLAFDSPTSTALETNIQASTALAARKIMIPSHQ